MPNYDFHQLSPHDLELLARDLLQAHWGVRIESFKSGKDSGIDLRYATSSNQTIIQVKHFLRTGLRGLLRAMRQEARNVRCLAPKRYVLITSVPLSPANKDEIVDSVGADVLAPGDVVGAEDLNNLLGLYPEVERAHYKLWLASRAVLDRVLHNAAATRSEFKAQEVYTEARRYVQSDTYPRAQEMLQAHRVVIIGGPPGVGKSTLADLLLYEHLERGYQAILLQRDVDEGLDLFQRDTRQIFHFDDFMGATFLDEGSSRRTGAQDRALLQFIAMVRNSPNARMVLTTREHIYAQAMEESERLRNSDLDDLRVFLRMPSYGFAERARILYNHLFFGDLPFAYRDELLRNDYYLRVVKHRKFNPRLIEWLSSYRRVRQVPVEHYRAFIDGLLDDPSEIWRHAYEREITNAGRSLLLAVRSLGGRVQGNTLSSAFEALHAQRAQRYGYPSRPEDYRAARRGVANTFVKPFGRGGVEVIDPSVLDLLNAVLASTPENAVDIMMGATSFDQVEQVWSLARRPEGTAMRVALRRHGDALAAVIEPLMVANRRIQHSGGMVSFRGPTFERRLAVTLDMAERLGDARINALVSVLFTRLCVEWTTESTEINDAVGLLRALRAADTLPTDDQAAMEDCTTRTLLHAIQVGCRSDELREVIGVVDMVGDAALAARRAFDSYQHLHFRDELREVQSLEELNGMIEDLELFRTELDVDVYELLRSVEAERDVFEEAESARADHMEDEWKERYHAERASERSVSDMFASLQGNGDDP